MPTYYDDSQGVFFEDLEVGDSFKSVARTITEADLVNFAALIGWYDPLHCDEVYAGQTPFGKRIAPGLLGLALSNGLCRGCFSTRVGRAANLAFVSVNWSFKKPIFIGDTIHVEQVISEKRETKSPERGLVTIKVAVLNQDGQEAQGGDKLFMLARRPR
ncbi:MAG: MaoC/PaaZ C-terminal domain-containing protein [Thermodesulfobacteriota bacterium]